MTLMTGLQQGIPSSFMAGTWPKAHHQALHHTKSCVDLQVLQGQGMGTEGDAAIRQPKHSWVLGERESTCLLLVIQASSKHPLHDSGTSGKGLFCCESHQLCQYSCYLATRCCALRQVTPRRYKKHVQSCLSCNHAHEGLQGSTMAQS